MVTRIQGVVAVGVPWLLAVVLVPDSAWTVVGLIVPLLFAALHARAWQAWLAPLSGVMSVLPIVPWWLSLVVAAAVGAGLVLRPPTREAMADGGFEHRGVIVIAGVLIVSGAVLATGLVLQSRQQDAAFDSGQRAAAQAWATASSAPDDISSTEASTPTGGLVGQPLEVQAEAAAPVQPPFARMRFVKKGSDKSVVTDRVLYVGPDVSERGLAAGPGHYPGTARPGKPGNIAIAGHRTGWGSPFLNLDDLEPGDRVKIVDRRGVRHTYVVRDSRLVTPTDDWVLGPDPLGTGEPTLTLTTCDPPEINSERLIVFATLAKSVPLKAA